MSTEKHILIIDDDPDAIAYLRAILKKRPYAITTAPDGEEGLSKARESPPDLILLDLMMPKKSGVKFINEIRQDERLKKIPIVVASGARQATGVDMRRYLEDQPFGEKKTQVLGTDHDVKPAAYLEKPIQPSELLATIEKLL
jgi:twitching motility two-component system response regulator PilH